MTPSDSTTPEDSSTSSPTPSKCVAPAKRPLHICIASPDFIGLSPHGGTGVAYTAMAQALAVAGHEVTCLFLGAKDPASSDWRRWVEKYQSDGLTLVALPQIKASELVAPTHLIRSYETYHWLKRNDRFDIIHFPDQRGPGYHTLTAKRHGLAFARTTICVGLHSMTAWLRAADRECMDMSGEVETDFMERQALALADAVVSPSHYLLNWISDNHWEMPSQRYVRQGMLAHAATTTEPPIAPGLREINELVYFGALETRKGVTIFCDALDAIPASIAENIKLVTFLGKEAVIDGMPARTYVGQRAQRWPFTFQVISGLEERQMMDYLRHKNRLAVIPSILDNLSCRVLECLEQGIAFITSRVGGIPELIAPADVHRVCFDPKPGSLCLLLCKVLTEGLRPARAALDAGENKQAWVALHENSLARSYPPVQPPRHVAAPTAAYPSESSNQAVRSAIQALSIDLKDGVALKTLARLHLKAGLFEAAQEACQIILKRNPKDAEALLLIEEAMIQEAKLMENLIDDRAISPAQEPRGQQPYQTLAGAQPLHAAPQAQP